MEDFFFKRGDGLAGGTDIMYRTMVRCDECTAYMLWSKVKRSETGIFGGENEFFALIDSLFKKMHLFVLRIFHIRWNTIKKFVSPYIVHTKNYAS